MSAAISVNYLTPQGLEGGRDFETRSLEILPTALLALGVERQGYRNPNLDRNQEKQNDNHG
jgi:hypothetical protein